MTAQAAAEYDAATGEVRRRRYCSALREQIAAQVLTGLGTWTPIPIGQERNERYWDVRTPEAQQARAAFAVAQADALLLALGYERPAEPEGGEA